MFDSSFFVAISFLIFVGLVIFMGLPKMIISALDKRSKDIQEELDEARNLREEAQKLLAKEKKNLDKAEEEAKVLLEKAEKQVKDLEYYKQQYFIQGQALAEEQKKVCKATSKKFRTLEIMSST